MIISQSVETTYISSNIVDTTPVLTDGMALKELGRYAKDHMIFTATRDETYDDSKPVEEQGLIPYMPTMPYRVLDGRTETIVKMEENINIKFSTNLPTTDIGISNVVAGAVRVVAPGGETFDIYPNNTIGKMNTAKVTVIQRGEWDAGDWDITIYKGVAGFAQVSFVVPAIEVISLPTYDNLKFGVKSKARVVDREYGTPDVIKRFMYATTDGELPVTTKEEEEEMVMFARNVTFTPFLINPADKSYNEAEHGANRASMYVGIFTQVQQKEKQKDDPDALTEFTFRSEATV